MKHDHNPNTGRCNRCGEHGELCGTYDTECAGVDEEWHYHDIKETEAVEREVARRKQK